MGMPKGTEIEPWTTDQIEFVRNAVRDCTVAEATAMLNAEFGTSRSTEAVKGSMARLGIRTGRTGRFEPGMEPKSKGKTWDELGIPEDSRNRIRSTCFKAGSVPTTGKAVSIGTERVTPDGYVEVKVRELSRRPGANDCWAPKQRIVYEREIGPIPPGHIVIFADLDRTNFDPENLVCIPKSLNATLNKLGIERYDRESCEAAIATARLSQAARSASLRNRTCKKCGKRFDAAFEKQSRCRECIDSAKRGRNGKRGTSKKGNKTQQDRKGIVA